GGGGGELEPVAALADLHRRRRDARAGGVHGVDQRRQAAVAGVDVGQRGLPEPQAPGEGGVDGAVGPGQRPRHAGPGAGHGTGRPAVDGDGTVGSGGGRRAGVEPERRRRAAAGHGQRRRAPLVGGGQRQLPVGADGGGQVPARGLLHGRGQLGGAVAAGGDRVGVGHAVDGDGEGGVGGEGRGGGEGGRPGLGGAGRRLGHLHGVGAGGETGPGREAADPEDVG